MKTTIIIIFLLLYSEIYGCENQLQYTCEVTASINKISETQHSEYDCCNEFCICNCCNHISFFTQIRNQALFRNSSTFIKLNCFQIPDDFSPSLWQPPNL